MTTIIIGRELLEQALGQLICNTNNMQKGMSKSIQKLCARENAEVLERLRTALAAPATAQAAEIERLKTESEERLQNCAALVAENEQLRKDAERYQWLAEYLVSDDESYDDAIVAATTVKEFDSVIDAAIKGTS